jgi:uncharacterized protein YggE
MRILSAIALLTVTRCFCHGQFGNSSGISVSGDAQVNVVPDRVTILLGVETRNKDLDMASAQNGFSGKASACCGAKTSNRCF